MIFSRTKERDMSGIIRMMFEMPDAHVDILYRCAVLIQCDKDARNKIDERCKLLGENSANKNRSY